MATYVKGFVDRQSTNPNYKVIDVKQQTTNYNGLPTYLAKVSRGDESISITGTGLNAKEINKAVIDLVYNELFGITFTEDLHDIEIIGNETYQFTIVCNERPLFVNCVCDNGINFGGSNQLEETKSTIKIDLTADTTLLTSVSEFDFRIELFTDMQRKNYLTSVNGHITYRPTSESSND